MNILITILLALLAIYGLLYIIPLAIVVIGRTTILFIEIWQILKNKRDDEVKK